MTYICQVKHVEIHISRLLVAIAVLLVFGNVAIASEAFSGKAKVSVVDYLNHDDNNKPFIFNEVSVGEVSQTVSQNEYLGLNFYGSFCSNQNFSFARVSSKFNSSYSSKDKRELIFRHLFPFHFFW